MMARIPTYKRYEQMEGTPLWDHVLYCIFCEYIADGPLAGMYRLCECGETEAVFNVVGFGQLDFEHSATGPGYGSDEVY
jgi:hypothetical protein